MANFNYNMQYNNNESIFTASIGKDGIIYQENPMGQKVAVGVDNQTVEEMQVTLDQYYNKLVELGVIEKEKTAEEIAKEQLLEQQKINQTLMESQQSLMAMVESLNEKIGGFENGNIRHDSEAGSANVGKKPNGNNGCSKSSKKVDTGNGKQS